MAVKKVKASRKRLEQENSFQSQALALALAAQDMAAVALALRNGSVIVPLLRSAEADNPRDAGEVWTFKDAKTGEVALLLFSDAQHIPKNLPRHVGVFSADWLPVFLQTHGETLTTVFLDIAGPHPMQAEPAELLRVLA